MKKGGKQRKKGEAERNRRKKERVEREEGGGKGNANKRKETDTGEGGQIKRREGEGGRGGEGKGERDRQEEREGKQTTIEREGKVCEEDFTGGGEARRAEKNKYGPSKGLWSASRLIGEEGRPEGETPGQFFNQREKRQR